MGGAAPTTATRFSRRSPRSARCRRRASPHSRCVGMIETCEESGSYDLPAYLEALAPRHGQRRFRRRTRFRLRRLRAAVGDDVAARTRRRHADGRRADRRRAFGRRERHRAVVVSHCAQHSRPARRLRRPAASCPPSCMRRIPAERVAQAQQGGSHPGRRRRHASFRSWAIRSPWSPTCAEACLNRTWRPALSIIGADGLPPIANAGNVLRPTTSLQLSLRLPPHDRRCRRHRRAQAICWRPTRRMARRCASTANPAPRAGTRRTTEPWLSRALDDASLRHYGKPSAAMGEGGTIPFMAMLGKHFPDAQFLITGVLGPKSNAHGPNEFLHIPYAKKLTACVADVLAAHAARDDCVSPFALADPPALPQRVLHLGKCGYRLFPVCRTRATANCGDRGPAVSALHGESTVPIALASREVSHEQARVRCSCGR